ncbi:phage tail domain-containing protein [Vagococcus fluvialis]|uniref:phage tail domain-containing protein n=1 Tax=Vagococcus fluvialis TaxID=2738 RepID=UPI002B2B2D34|nr:phage tail family protein [Vagococcus fluvialis]
MVELLFIKDDIEKNITEFINTQCIEVNLKPPEISFGNLKYLTDDGERETDNNTFNPFDITVRLLMEYDSIEDYFLRTAELKSYLYSRSSYYLVFEYMPGKRYPVQIKSFEPEVVESDGAVFEVIFNCFKGYSESIESTINVQDVTSQDWQFSQGIVSQDTSYSYRKNNFVIQNLGGFSVDPRKKHYLKIVLKGESDGMISIINKTNGSKFIYQKPLSSRKGETIELIGVEPSKNGVQCGIDCPSIGPIILSPGENKIEIKNTSNVEVFFDFRHLYKV